MQILITSIVDVEQTAHGRLYQFLKHLSSEHDVTIISIKDWWKARKGSVGKGNKELEKILEKVEIKHLTEKEVSPILQELYSFYKIPSLLNDIGYRSFDVHLNYNSLIAGYAVTRKLRKEGIGTVYDIADDLPEMIKTSPQIPAIMRPAGGLLGKAVLERSVKKSQIVTVPGKFLKEEIGSGDVRIIPNGVEIDSFRYSSPKELRSELSIEKDFVIGYIGALREWVDLEPVFAALKDLKERKDVKFLIVGGEEGFDSNKKLAAKYGVEDNTLFVGAVPYTKVPEYISSMDLCLIPFKKNKVADNSCPLKLFEYMACERPVICTPLNEVEHVVGNKVKYASGPAEYVEQITGLYDDPELCKSMGSEGRKYVQEDYSWSKINMDIEKILKEVIEKRP
jgi:glycosyltransferase involved in cell wall biosynthesis